MQAWHRRQTRAGRQAPAGKRTLRATGVVAKSSCRVSRLWRCEAARLVAGKAGSSSRSMLLLQRRGRQQGRGRQAASGTPGAAAGAAGAAAALAEAGRGGRGAVRHRRASQAGSRRLPAVGPGRGLRQRVRDVGGRQQVAAIHPCSSGQASRRHMGARQPAWEARGGAGKPAPRQEPKRQHTQGRLLPTAAAAADNGAS